jgi:hypothetical protein
MWVGTALTIALAVAANSDQVALRQVAIAGALMGLDGTETVAVARKLTGQAARG